MSSCKLNVSSTFGLKSLPVFTKHYSLKADLIWSQYQTSVIARPLVLQSLIRLRLEALRLSVCVTASMMDSVGLTAFRPLTSCKGNSVTQCIDPSELCSSIPSFCLCLPFVQVRLLLFSSICLLIAAAACGWLTLLHNACQDPSQAWWGGWRTVMIYPPGGHGGGGGQAHPSPSSYTNDRKRGCRF